MTTSYTFIIKGSWWILLLFIIIETFLKKFASLSSSTNWFWMDIWIRRLYRISFCYLITIYCTMIHKEGLRKLFLNWWSLHSYVAIFYANEPWTIVSSFYQICNFYSTYTGAWLFILNSSNNLETDCFHLFPKVLSLFKGNILFINHSWFFLEIFKIFHKMWHSCYRDRKMLFCSWFHL